LRPSQIGYWPSSGAFRPPPEDFLTQRTLDALSRYRRQWYAYTTRAKEECDTASVAAAKVKADGPTATLRAQPKAWRAWSAIAPRIVFGRLAAAGNQN